jgi:hypothetical protein
MQQLQLCLLAAAFWSGTAIAAAKDETLPVDLLTAKAAVAGVATVQSSSARVNPANNMIYTDYVLKFSDVWKGEPGDSFILTRAGGQIGDRTVRIAHYDFKLNAGDPLVVFAGKNDMGEHVIIGIHQGVYRVDGDNVRRVLEPRSGRADPMTLLALRQEVFRASGRPWTEPPKRMDSPSNSKPFGAAATPGTVPGAPATPVDPVRQTEASGGFSGMIVAGLLILAAVVLIFVLRKSKAKPEQSR